MLNLIRFGDFELDAAAAELKRNGRKVRLPEQQFQIGRCSCFAKAMSYRGRRFARKLWPNDTVVEFDRSINAARMKLRVALSDSAEEPRFVETQARRGYRFLVPVEVI